jgi:hypothetical protein
MPSGRQAIRCTGITSSTSLATSAPEKRSGRPSSQLTRLARWGPCGQGVELALAQFAGHFENAVAFGQGVATFQFKQQIGSQQAGAGAGFDQVGADKSMICAPGWPGLVRTGA